MTLAQAKARLAPLAISLSKQGAEYRVNYSGGKDATAYYTDDIKDAVDTGLVMAAWKARTTN